MRRILVAFAALAVLSGCSGGGDPAPVPSGSTSAVSQDKQATIDGEWILTRTVTSTDDVSNPARAVAAVSTRYVKFGDISCPIGPCTGGVLSGPTQTVRDTTTFTSAGDVITYEFSGFINCLRADTGAVLVPNGYSFTASVELKVVATDAVDTTKASTLEGTLVYTDTVTNEALEAGCSREPVTTTTEYALSAIRGALAPVTGSTPTPAP
jgi:hypothetical protein